MVDTRQLWLEIVSWCLRETWVQWVEAWWVCHLVNRQPIIESLRCCPVKHLLRALESLHTCSTRAEKSAETSSRHVAVLKKGLEVSKDVSLRAYLILHMYVHGHLFYLYINSYFFCLYMIKCAFICFQCIYMLICMATHWCLAEVEVDGAQPGHWQFCLLHEATGAVDDQPRVAWPVTTWDDWFVLVKHPHCWWSPYSCWLYPTLTVWNCPKRQTVE